MTAAHRARWNPYKPQVRRDFEGWSVLLDGRWHPHGSWGRAIDAALDHCAEHSPGCGRKGCPCRIPEAVCSFRGRILGDGQYCPRCGWSRRRHEGDA